METDPQLAIVMEIDGSESAEEAAARFRRHPGVVSALARHGFTPEQYVQFMQNMIGAMFAQAALEGGHISELPPEINEADVRFIAANREWMQERWSRLEQLGVDSDDYEDEGH